jgi:hypothetical protein
MVRWRRYFSLVSLATATALAPALACGPFLYDNAELDQFSLLDPGILNNSEWDDFLAFASPAYGQKTDTSSDRAVQLIIRPDRLNEVTSPGVSNALYDYSPGLDPISVAANEAWWTQYFDSARHRAVTPDELQTVLYGPKRPAWLAAADRRYLALLDGEPDDPRGLTVALTEARNLKNPEGLRHRFAFWAVRSLALGHDAQAVRIFREFSPGQPADLPLARAQGWAASVLADTDPRGALELWTDLFVRWPNLRVQTFGSLATLPTGAWSGNRSPGALVARFFLESRDFSPETLGALAEAEHTAGGDGSWSEAVFYAMAEQIEKEAGVFALFGLVDPTEVSPSGLFTGLIDQSVTLADRGTVKATRTWWLIASYLALFDGDPARAAQLLSRAQSLPARNADQEHQSDLIGALLQMHAEKDQDWSVTLQNRVLSALDWGQSLDAPGHNRGLYHSVAVLVAQKELARGHNPQAALAFGLVQGGSWSNPYQVADDDSFWATAWSANNSVNLLMDALMSDEDLDAWKGLLKARDLSPLTARLVAHPFLTTRDLTWWQAHRALRRGKGDQAVALLKTLGPAPQPDPDRAPSVFSERTFHYSLDLDPLDPAGGRGFRAVSPQALASVMAKIESEASAKPTSRSLLNRGQFWFSLQLSGLPLLFSQPPALISFTNGNFEYYGYDGRDSERTKAVVGTFPLGRPSQTDLWAQRLQAFYRDEFSTLGKARQAFEAVLARRDDPEAEYKALLFLQAIDRNQGKALADPRYDKVPLAEEFRSTCEDFQSGLL